MSNLIATGRNCLHAEFLPSQPAAPNCALERKRLAPYAHGVLCPRCEPRPEPPSRRPRQRESPRAGPRSSLLTTPRAISDPALAATDPPKVPDPAKPTWGAAPTGWRPRGNAGSFASRARLELLGLLAFQENGSVALELGGLTLELRVPALQFSALAVATFGPVLGHLVVSPRCGLVPFGRLPMMFAATSHSATQVPGPGRKHSAGNVGAAAGSAGGVRSDRVKLDGLAEPHFERQPVTSAGPRTDPRLNSHAAPG
jgi:hypothetical protein